MAKVAVILAGCGVYDGAEINEAVLTLLHLAKAGAEVICFAPDQAQMHTINHMTGEPMDQPRNVMVEAARITRGAIHPLTELDATKFDALIVPGGFGAAKNLCDFAVKGTAATINNAMFNACSQFAKANKPAGYMCIAPAMIPLIYGAATSTNDDPKSPVKLTIGNDPDTAAAITQLGSIHVDCAVDEIVIDAEHKVVTTPAYMLAQNLVEADAGISKLVTATLAMI